MRELIDLCQCRFHKGRRSPEKRHGPHPEHRTRPAERNRRRHAHNIPGSHASGKRNTKRLKRRNPLCPLLLGKQRLKHQLKPTHLHKPRPEREIQSGGDQQHDEGGIPYDPIDLGNYLFEHGFKGTKNLPFWRLFLFGGLDASAPCVFQRLRQVGKALDG